MLIGRLIFNEFVKIQKENFIDIKQVMQQLKRNWCGEKTAASTSLILHLGF